MKLFSLLSISSVSAYYEPGVDLVDCSEHFTEGLPWPLEDNANAGETVRICQNKAGQPYSFATLFSTSDRIPVYSAVKIARYSNKDKFKRPDSHWDYQCNGLCVEDESPPLPSRQSFLCNLAYVGYEHFDVCGKNQAVDTDYKGNTGDLGIDRGHLLPNALMNQDENAQRATFTLTNVSAQYSKFNQVAWNQLECMVRHYLDRDIDGKEAYVMVGTEGKKLVMNEDNPEKNPVVLAQNYWTAFCYTDGAETYSWVYVQENSPDSVQSSGDLFMSANDFSDTFYEGAPIFDDNCQNPKNGYGPWFKIIADWELYKVRYGCDYDRRF